MRDDTIPVPGAADRAVAYGDLTDELLAHRLLDRRRWWPAPASRSSTSRSSPSAAASAPSSRSTTCGSAGVPTSADPGPRPSSTRPWQTYEYLTRVSQIPRGERLRSDSASRPDNIWGFPSYALRGGDRRKRQDAQAAVARAHRADLRRLLHARRPGRRSRRWSGRRTGSATRTCWSRARSGWCAGATGGGYFTILTPPAGRHADQAGRVPQPLRARRRRLPGPEVPARPAGLPRRATATTASVVNAYEPHEHVYERLTPRAGHRAGPRRRHRRLPGAAAADRRPRRSAACRPRSCTSSAPTSTGAHGPHIFDAPARAATAGPTRASTTRSRCGAASSRPRCASSRARSAPSSTS